MYWKSSWKSLQRRVARPALVTLLFWPAGCAIDLEQARTVGATGVEVTSSLGHQFDDGIAATEDRGRIDALYQALGGPEPPDPASLAMIHTQLVEHRRVMRALVDAYAAFYELAAFDDGSEIGVRFTELKLATDHLASTLKTTPLPADQVAIVEAGLRLMARWFQASHVAQENERLVVLARRAKELLDLNRNSYERQIDAYYSSRWNVIQALAQEPAAGSPQPPIALDVEAELADEFARLGLPASPAKFAERLGEPGSRKWVVDRLEREIDAEKENFLAQVGASINALEKLIEAHDALAESKSIDVKGILEIIDQVRQLEESAPAARDDRGAVGSRDRGSRGSNRAAHDRSRHDRGGRP